MKKIAMIILFLYTYSFSFAQDKGNASTSQLLTAYYNLKDALVAGNTNAVASGAGEFIKKLNAVDKGIIKDEDRNPLFKEGTAISKTNNLSLQRERFAILSASMIALAKKVKLTTGPVYQQYCPMKKSSWLSINKAIKNPYYGSAMLTCGSVVDTL